MENEQNEKYEQIYTIFMNLLRDTSYEHNKQKHTKCIYIIKNSMKDIYKSDKLAFEYVFEKIYSNCKNPFLSAYREFMNYLVNGGYSEEDLLYFIAEGILQRYLKELTNCNKYTVFTF